MSRQDLKDLIDFSKKFGLMSYKVTDAISFLYFRTKVGNKLLYKFVNEFEIV